MPRLRWRAREVGEVAPVRELQGASIGCLVSIPIMGALAIPLYMLDAQKWIAITMLLVALLAANIIGAIIGGSHQ